MNKYMNLGSQYAKDVNSNSINNNNYTIPHSIFNSIFSCCRDGVAYTWYIMCNIFLKIMYKLMLI